MNKGNRYNIGKGYFIEFKKDDNYINLKYKNGDSFKIEAYDNKNKIDTIKYIKNKHAENFMLKHIGGESYKSCYDIKKPYKCVNNEDCEWINDGEKEECKNKTENYEIKNLNDRDLFNFILSNIKKLNDIIIKKNLLVEFYFITRFNKNKEKDFIDMPYLSKKIKLDEITVFPLILRDKIISEENDLIYSTKVSYSGKYSIKKNISFLDKTYDNFYNFFEEIIKPNFYEIIRVNCIIKRNTDNLEYINKDSQLNLDVVETDIIKGKRLLEINYLTNNNYFKSEINQYILPILEAIIEINNRFDLEIFKEVTIRTELLKKKKEEESRISELKQRKY